jgi:predicted small secreted protein
MNFRERRSFLWSLGAMVVSAAVLGACNTVEGVGRDIENAGDAIEDKASETRRRRRRAN